MTPPDPVSALVGRLKPDDSAFAASLLRGRNVAGREVFARRITDGALGAADLQDLAGACAASDGGLSGLPRADRGGLASYAYLLAVQLGTAPDQWAALGLYRALVKEGVTLKQRDAETYAQLLLAAGRLDDALTAAQAKNVRPTVANMIRADALNPSLRPGSDPGDWGRALSAALLAPDTVPLALLPSGRTAYDRLTTGAPDRAGTLNGPLIAVVMSAFDPDERLLTAVRSLIDQTWSDWELLIVDDASPAPTPGILEQAEAMDPRVRVIRKAVNGGTYRARNTALRQTGADFFTCLDSDDWAHPQRLEKGIAPLLADPQLMATRSMGVRADEDLVITRPGYHGYLINAPSLLVRMYPAVHRIGLFDTVRKAADTEYAVRLEAAFPVRIETLREDVLTMARLEATSLSYGEFSPGWRHEARSAYRQAYGRWHQAIRDGGDPYLDPEAPRIFPAPARWQRPVDPRLAVPRVLDVVLVADVRTGPPAVAQTAQRARALHAAGLRVGLLHLEDLAAYAPKEAPLDPALLDLIDDATIERVYLEDDLRADVVLIGEPGLLHFPPWTERVFPTGRVVLLDPPQADPEAGADLDRDRIEAAARELFAAEPVWRPAPTDDQALVAVVRGTADSAEDSGPAGDSQPTRAADGDALIADEDDSDDIVPVRPHTGAQAWLTIRTRRPGDGEHADSLAIRHTAGDEGEAAAAETARQLLDRLPAGAAATADDVAACAQPGVTAIAQNLSGEVVRLPVSLSGW